MSSFIIAHDSHIMMLELAIDKLFAPFKTPFDAIVLSKSIVSFRFLYEDWIDVMPNRLDYKKYRGSCCEEQNFYGGKSLVFSIPSSYLNDDSKLLDNLTIEISARREISEYFEMESHIRELGSVHVEVQDLLGGIIEELRLRRELHGFLNLAHERDPICRSMKGKYTLEDPETCEPTDCRLEVYVRLSHLGSCVITEIDRFSTDPTEVFYAQEDTNNGPAYECRQLDPENVKPTTKQALLTWAREQDCFICDCSDEQKYNLLLGDNTRCQATCTDDDKDGKGDGDDDGKKKKKKKCRDSKDQGTCTEGETCDRETLTCGPGKVAKDGVCKSKNPLDDLSDADLLALIRAQRRGGGASIGIVDRPRQGPICETEPICCPVEICIQQPVCLPTQTCLPEVCCYD